MFLDEIDGNIQLDIKKTPCAMRTIEQWDKLGRMVVLSPSLLVGVQGQGVQIPEQPV